MFELKAQMGRARLGQGLQIANCVATKESVEMFAPRA